MLITCFPKFDLKQFIMALQDSNPERRNLLLISLLFITFYLGGGAFPKNEIRLQVISVTFSNPEVLFHLVWGLFFWFLYRYWVVHKNSFREEIKNEISSYQKKEFVIKELEGKVGCTFIRTINESKRDEKEVGCTINRFYWNKTIISAAVIQNEVSRNNYGQVQSTRRLLGRDKINGRFDLDKITSYKVCFLCALENPSSSSYIFPYLFSLLAICLGGVDYIQRI